MWSVGIAGRHPAALAEREDSPRNALTFFLLGLFAAGALILAGSPASPLEGQDTSSAIEPAVLASS